jgi:hypothetical protein
VKPPVVEIPTSVSHSGAPSPAASRVASTWSIAS